MKLRASARYYSIAVVILIILITVNAYSEKVGSELEAGFRSPPVSARPHTWWHWMNGNVTEEGITRDLEAMKRAGIGGFQIFQVGSDIPKGPVDYGSFEHQQLLKHAAKEADRLGLEFSMHNCPGWSSSGGPWITPEMAMQQLVWSETYVKGGELLNITLPQPHTRLNYYRDAFVLAFPSPGGENRSMEEFVSRVTSSSGPVDAKLLSDGDPSAGVDIHPADPDEKAFMQMEFADPYEARSILIYSSSLAERGAGGARFGGEELMSLEASEDGMAFRKICEINLADVGFDDGVEVPLTENFSATRAKYFRLVWEKARRIAEVRLSGIASITDWPRKANSGGRFGGDAGASTTLRPTVESPGGSAIDPETVLDITRYMDDRGRLNWQAPRGDWTILRLGHTPTGVENHPAPDGGLGLECDKFSRAAMDYHFKHFFGELLPMLESLGAKGMAGSIIDSYEVGMQNWTVDFPQEFLQRRGYDLWKYLPAMTGRVVGNADISDRFLWDVRRVQSDMMADNYYGRFAELCREHGMIAYAEPYGGGPFDEMQSGSRVDAVMGEFWQGQDNHHSVKVAASIAHVNGLNVVGAESFTSRARWMSYPYALKGLGDYVFTLGLNRYIFHRFAMQPHLTAVPGMTMGPWGWHFDRTNTWFDQSSSWIDYVTRCQYMLQQGLFVADLAYLTSGEAPEVTTGKAYLTPEVPEGYDFDTINPEAVLNRASVKDGQMVLPDGMSYRILVLPDKTTITRELLSKIRDLVSQGLWLVGPKPEHSLSLAGYPENEEAVRAMADEVWGALNGTTATERTFGQGRVFWGTSLPEVLAKRDLPPDFRFTSRSGEADINYIHRRGGNIDLYFLANRGAQSEDLVCTFRVEGKQPEFWNAVTGEISPIEVFDLAEGGIRVPVRLDPAGSIFVLFRSPAPSRHLQSIAKDGVAIAGTEPFPIKRAASEAPRESSSMGPGRWQRQKFPMPTLEEPSALDLSGGANGELLIWQNGVYSLKMSGGESVNVEVSEISRPMEITGPWHISFPPDLGAPPEVELDNLISWTEHTADGVKYFSGTATYTKQFKLPDGVIADGQRMYLDLGRVEVIAEVLLNGQNLGILWMPPFRVDITDTVQSGDNTLEVKVTNLWPNRLIGDEQLPEENEYGQDGAIQKLPDWYLEGKPKPAGGRVTFTTWHHWDADDPLTESGLIGPVLLRTAVNREIAY